MVSIPGKIVSQQFAYGCLFQIHKISKNTTRGKCKCWTLSISVSRDGSLINTAARAALCPRPRTPAGGPRCPAQRAPRTPRTRSREPSIKSQRERQESLGPRFHLLQQGQESQKKINVWRCLATRTITKNTQTLHQKTRETEVDSP